MFGLGHQKPRHYKGDQVRCGGRTLFAALGVRHVSSAARGRRRFAPGNLEVHWPEGNVLLSPAAV